MAATIQEILKPKKYRIKDTSSSLQPKGDNLLTNGNFSNDSSGLAVGWYSGNNTNDTESITTGHPGFPANAQKIVSGGNGSGGVGNTFLYQEIGSLDNYSTYEISYYERSSHGCAAYIVEQSPNQPHLGSQGKVHAATGVTGSDQAVKHTWQFETGGSTGTTYIRFYNRTTGIDSVSGDIIEIGDVTLKKCNLLPNNRHGELFSGRALEFDGIADELEIPGGSAGISGINAFEHTNGDAFTIACWINAASDSLEFYIGRNQSSVLMFYIDPVTGGFKLGYRPDGSPSGDGLVDGQDPGSGDSYFDFSTTALPLNTWHRVVYVGTGVDSTLHCYVNGQLYGTLNADTKNRTNDFYFYRADLVQGYKGVQAHISNIGSPYGTDLTYGYKGMISDFQIWDSAWSASDVTYDYLNPESLALNSGGTSLTESNLKIWYPMNEGHKGQSFVMDASNLGFGPELITQDIGTASNWTKGAIGGSVDASTTVTGNADGSVTFETAEGSNWQTVSIPFQAVKNTSYKVSITGESLEETDGDNEDKFYWRVGDTSNDGHDTTNINTSWMISEGLKTKFRYFNSQVNTGTAYFIGMFKKASGSVHKFRLDSVTIKSINEKHHATTVFTGDDGWNKADNYVEKGTNKWDASLASNLTSNNSGTTIGADIAAISTGTGQDATHMGINFIPGMASSGVGILLNNTTSGALSSAFGDLVKGRNYRVEFSGTTGSCTDTANFAVHNGNNVITTGNQNVRFNEGSNSELGGKVLNGDFNDAGGSASSAVNWTQSTDADRETSGGHSTLEYMSLETTSGPTENYCHQTITGLTAGSQYLLTFWAKGGGSTSQSIRTRVQYDGDNVNLSTTDTGYTTATWKKFNYQFTASHTSATVYFYSPTVVGTVALDDVKVSKFEGAYIDFTAGHSINAYLYAKDMTTSKSTSNSVIHLSALETNTTGWIKYPEDGAQAAAVNVDIGDDGSTTDGTNDATKFTAVGSNKWFGRNTSNITLEAGYKYQVQGKIFIPSSTSDYATGNGNAFLWWDVDNSDVVQTIQRVATVDGGGSSRGSWYTVYTLLDCTGLDSSHDLTARLYLKSQNNTVADDFLYLKNVYIYRLEDVYIDNIVVKQKGIASGFMDADRQPDIPQTALQSYSNLGWFEGGDERLHPDENYTPTDSVTCAFWVFLNGNDGENRGLIDNIHWYNSGWRITADENNRLKLQTSSGSGSDDGSINGYVTETDNIITRGKWIHCAVAFKKTAGASNGHVFYVNGHKMVSNTGNVNGSHEMTQVARKLRIGYGGGLTQSYHNGTFADCSIWNTMLNESDVQEIYNDGKMFDQLTHTKKYHLLHYWRNDGASDWVDRKGSHDMEWRNTDTATPPNTTILLPSSVDGSTDSQGFFLNKKRTTNSLNLKGDVLVTIGSSSNADYVRTRNYFPLANAGFTMSMWLKMHDYSGRGIVGMNDGTVHRMYIGQSAAGSDTALFGCGSNYNSVANVIPLNQWVHLAQTWDGTNQKLFVNGVYKATSTTGQSGGATITFTGESSKEFGITGFTNLPTVNATVQYPVRGIVDDILVYNRAVSYGDVSIDDLSKGEMGRIYKAGERSHKND